MILFLSFVHFNFVRRQKSGQKSGQLVTVLSLRETSTVLFSIWYCIVNNVRARVQSAVAEKEKVN